MASTGSHDVSKQQSFFDKSLHVSSSQSVAKSRGRVTQPRRGRTLDFGKKPLPDDLSRLDVARVGRCPEVDVNQQRGNERVRSFTGVCPAVVH